MAPSASSAREGRESPGSHDEAGFAPGETQVPQQSGGTVIVADYPFFGILWSMLIFFLWVSWFWLLITIAGDVFRRHDIGGGKKAVWLLFMIFVPFIGVFSYLIANSEGMALRAQERAEREMAAMRGAPRAT
jgi:phospholipase D-like protein